MACGIVVTSDGRLPAVASDTGRETTVASTQFLRVDADGLLPSLLVILMLILAMLGIVAQAAAL